MNIYQLIKELNAFGKNIAIAAQAALNKEADLLVAEFQRRSPVDSGAYKGGWGKFPVRFSSSNVIAGTVIRNSDPKAALMEFGADPRTAPWYYPNKANTGKLTIHGGKVWAGGLNPGHQYTIGGAIGPGLYNNHNRQLQLANSIANRVIRAI